MTYQRFEDVPVWREAINLGQRIYAFTQQTPFQRQRSLRDQIERAAVSVSNNIAEGFERGTTQELITFLYYARGSAGEVRSMLWLMEGLPGFANSKSEISTLRSLSESCARQLRAWADSLQNSAIKGQRHLTEASRRRDEAAKRAAAFREKLKSMLPPRG
jgi:four helix bundle protein